MPLSLHYFDSACFLSLVIDLTTHNKNGTKEMKDIFDRYKISFVVSPVMGSKKESLKEMS